MAGTSILWLKAWHQYGFSRTRIAFPPFSNWGRDSKIVLLPVLLAVWVGVALAQMLITRSGNKFTVSTNTILVACILAGIGTAAVILVEGSRVIGTGIGNEYVFLTSVCTNLYQDGNVLLNILRWMIPGTRALRLHILLQDGIYLAAVNLAVVIFLVFILETGMIARNSLLGMWAASGKMYRG